MGVTGRGLYNNVYPSLFVADQAAYFGAKAYMSQQFGKSWPKEWNNNNGLTGTDCLEIDFKAPRGGWFYDGDTWLKAFLGVSSSGGPR